MYSQKLIDETEDYSYFYSAFTFSDRDINKTYISYDNGKIYAYDSDNLKMGNLKKNN